MSQLNDAIYAALNPTYGPGQLNDLLVAYYRDQLGDPERLGIELWDDDPYQINSPPWTKDGPNQYTADGTADGPGNRVKLDTGKGGISGGNVYRVSFNVTAVTQGAVRIILVSDELEVGRTADVSTTGPYTEDIKVDGSTNIPVSRIMIDPRDGTLFAGTITNISVKEVRQIEQINDLEYLWLSGQVGVNPGQINDMWYQYTGLLGYTGALNDRLLEYWSGNLANDYIKDFNNWDQGGGVSFSQVDFGGRSGVWRLDNTSTSGITMTYDFAARESNGGPQLETNENYTMAVDVYSPSANTQTGAGTWYTTDTLGDRSWSAVEDQWKRLETTLNYQPGDDLYANAAANLSASAGDFCFFDLNSLVIRKVI